MVRKVIGTVTGLDKLERKLRRYPEIVNQVVRRHLFQEAEGIMTAAKQLTPVDEGTLRSSGHVQLPKKIKGKVTVLLGFGGPAGIGNQGETNRPTKANPTGDVGYALIVHEDLNAYHKTGGAKYLETPFLQASKGFKDRLIKAIKQATAGVGI